MLTRRTPIPGAASAGLAAPAFAADASATAFVTAIYDAYRGKDAKGIPLDSERAIRRYFEPKLASLMVKDQQAAARRHEVGLPDFDPFLDAQDWDVTTVDIAVGDAVAGKALATVNFVSIGEPRRVLLDLIQVKKAWRIQNITWQREGEMETLRGLFVH